MEWENDSSFPQKKKTSDRDPVLDEKYDLGPFGRNVPSVLVTVSHKNNGDARISPENTILAMTIYGFIRKVLKDNGATCPYGVILNFAPSGTSLPPKSYLPRYVDPQEIASSQVCT
ncbi:hypothetical protein H5410_045631, partial [Solanum commersonii]